MHKPTVLATQKGAVISWRAMSGADGYAVYRKTADSEYELIGETNATKYTDADVEKFLKLFSFLSLDEIDQIVKGDINKAKERLAWEVTKEIHGKEEADKALEGAKAAFGGGGDKSHMPTAEIEKSNIENGIGIIDLFAQAKLGGSRSDIRRLVEQGGACVNEVQITDPKTIINTNNLDSDGELILRAGKKKFCRITLV